jgi:hypothetical protein
MAVNVNRIETTLRHASVLAVALSACVESESGAPATQPMGTTAPTPTVSIEAAYCVDFTILSKPPLSSEGGRFESCFRNRDSCRRAVNAYLLDQPGKMYTDLGNGEVCFPADAILRVYCFNAIPFHRFVPAIRDTFLCYGDRTDESLAKSSGYDGQGGGCRLAALAFPGWVLSACEPLEQIPAPWTDHSTVASWHCSDRSDFENPEPMMGRLCGPTLAACQTQFVQESDENARRLFFIDKGEIVCRPADVHDVHCFTVGPKPISSAEGCSPSERVKDSHDVCVTGNDVVKDGLSACNRRRKYYRDASPCYDVGACEPASSFLPDHFSTSAVP